MLAGGSVLACLHGPNKYAAMTPIYNLILCLGGHFNSKHTRLSLLNAVWRLRFICGGSPDLAERKRCAWVLMKQIVKGLGEATPDCSGVIVLKATNITLEVENGAKYQVIFDFKPWGSGVF